MITVPALSWQQVGAQLLANVPLNFGLDVDYRILISGSIGSDYHEARALDVNAYQLAPGVTMTLTFNAVPHVILAGNFHTYNVAPHQRYIDVQASAGAPNVALLTFYPVNRPEWR